MEVVFLQNPVFHYYRRTNNDEDSTRILKNVQYIVILQNKLGLVVPICQKSSSLFFRRSKAKCNWQLRRSSYDTHVVAHVKYFPPYQSYYSSKYNIHKIFITKFMLTNVELKTSSLTTRSIIITYFQLNLFFILRYSQKCDEISSRIQAEEDGNKKAQLNNEKALHLVHGQKARSVQHKANRWVADLKKVLNNSSQGPSYQQTVSNSEFDLRRL